MRSIKLKTIIYVRISCNGILVHTRACVCVCVCVCENFYVSFYKCRMLWNVVSHTLDGVPLLVLERLENKTQATHIFANTRNC